MNAIDFLTEQHRSMEKLLAGVLEGKDEAAKRDRFTRVADELTMHITSEEKLFYPAVRAQRTEDILLESLEEHLGLKRFLADLLAMKVSDSGFEPKFKVLKEQAEHHHKEEEEKLFPKVRTLLAPAALDEIGQQMEGLQEELRHKGAPREAVMVQTKAAAPLAGTSS